jgi:serine/threonine protein kinase
MLHLHSEGVVHGDLKAGNVLLRSAAGSQRRSTAAAAGGGGSGFGGVGVGSSGPWPGQEVLMAKVADFGLASQLQEQDTHISGVHRVSGGRAGLKEADGALESQGGKDKKRGLNADCAWKQHLFGRSTRVHFIC